MNSRVSRVGDIPMLTLLALPRDTATRHEPIGAYDATRRLEQRSNPQRA